MQDQMVRRINPGGHSDAPSIRRPWRRGSEIKLTLCRMTDFSGLGNGNHEHILLSSGRSCGNHGVAHGCNEAVCTGWGVFWEGCGDYQAHGSSTQEGILNYQ